MPQSDRTLSYSSAIEDFRAARRKASIEKIFGWVFGQTAELLDYEQVRQSLRITSQVSGRTLREIPLNSIVGSVGRYTDFTRSFLPTTSVNPHRWADIKIAATGLAGLPPIEVYQIGDSYFVLDGNHRVSVARQLEATHIEAYVTEFQTHIPLPPDTSPDDLIVKAEYAEFLENTKLDTIRPEADLSVSLPGQYRQLEEHISVHHYYMGLDQQRDIPYADAVASWYDNVYMPVVLIIRHRGVMRDFPSRTETDLYLWTARHRGDLIQELGWEIDSTRVASTLGEDTSPRVDRVVSRIGEWLLETITPEELTSGPSIGSWRRDHLETQQSNTLFSGILIPISGEDTGWKALDQGIIFAQKENAYLHGLHVVSKKNKLDGKKVRAVHDKFTAHCENAGIRGQLVTAVGKTHRQVCAHARWTDLVILSLMHPPLPTVPNKLGSGIRKILRRCAGPVLVVPDQPTALRCGLLAYDGSPKAEEALFVATYLAGHFGMNLLVVNSIEEEQTVPDGQAPEAHTTYLDHAREYLEAHGIQADFLQLNGSPAAAILAAAERRDCDLIIMGSYGYSPVLEIVMGSTVDEILRSTSRPTLVCQ